MELEYNNTQRTDLKLREYGRNVQNLIEHLKTIDDKEERNKQAATLVELMSLVNPDINKDSMEHNHKIWDDLYIISDFELEVEGPFPKPDKKILGKRPEQMDYHSNNIKYKHYGRSVELLVEKAVKIADPKEKEAAVIAIGKLMKAFYKTWNKDTIEDKQVLENMKKLSNGELTIDIETVKEFKLFDSERKSGGGGRRSSNNNKGRNNKGASRNRKRS
ncbi:MAG: DUF4290 domain-containing protein [Ekhidna sp.]|nr:DUF4290 domain-containing protein [Ekhidna sp.]